MRSVKPVVFFAALLALVAGLGVAAPAAGNTTSVTATASGANAFSVIATYTNTPAGAPATLTANGAGGFTTATASGATGVTVSGFVAGSKTVTTTADVSGVATNTITIQATFTCQAPGQVTFTLTQTAGVPGTSSSQPMTCSASGGTTTGGLSINPPTVAPGQQATISGTCQAGASLIANPPAGQFVNATINGQPAQPIQGGVACTTAGTLTAMYVCSQPTQVTFTLVGATGTLSCGGGAAAATAQNPYGQPPYGGQQFPSQSVPNINQATQGGPNLTNANAGNTGSPVSIQVSPSNVTCGSQATVSVSARGQDGQAVNQGNVNLYTTTGAVEPKNGTISNGKFDTKFTAPSTGGTATIAANVGGVTNSVDVKVDCAGGAPGASASSPSTATTSSLLNNPASPPPPPFAAPVISPPSTGDAGLLAHLSE